MLAKQNQLEIRMEQVFEQRFSRSSPIHSFSTPARSAALEVLAYDSSILLLFFWRMLNRFLMIKQAGRAAGASFHSYLRSARAASRHILMVVVNESRGA